MKGGISIVLLIDLEQHLNEKMNKNAQNLKKTLTLKNIKTFNWKIYNSIIKFHFDKSKTSIILNNINHNKYSINILPGQAAISFSKFYLKKTRNELLLNTMEIIDNRINNLGNKEIEIRKEHGKLG